MSYVREIRKRLGLSQIELGKKLGVRQGTVSRFETGTLPVDERTMLALDALLMRAEAANANGAATVALCGNCERRSDHPEIHSCVAVGCPMRLKEAA